MELFEIVQGNASVYGKAIGITLLASGLAIVFALFLGLLLALMRDSRFSVFSGFARLYVSFFRGTPLLLQILILYNGLVVFQLSGFQALAFGLSLHFAAYISESFRAAISSVDRGQWEAAESLGIPRRRTFKDIILPQALSRAIPPLSNSVIDIIKSTSLGTVIAVEELTYVSDQIAATTYLVMPLLLFSALVYWLISTAIQGMQHRLEARYRIPE
ncbi:amino acid ABC transporter permease [Exiguobacterium flavidum]|uniref:amino acid ABC transporter permease n=1 Tax=Exiguobacterium flavidum TaxID=2184695 RepID=UPI000DF77894|nr:amino acid ABC transporter permease [Exiguobacterium flavidum]